MIIAKYFGLKNGGTAALTLSKRSLNQAAGFARPGNVSVCLHRGTCVSTLTTKGIFDGTADILGQPSTDIIECPNPLSEVRTKRVSEIVESDDVS